MSYDKTNPPHYRSHPSGIECIEVVRHFRFNIGSAIKYLWRLHAGKPGETELDDLRKARWYIDDEIRRLEPASPETAEFTAEEVPASQWPVGETEQAQPIATCLRCDLIYQWSAVTCPACGEDPNHPDSESAQIREQLREERDVESD